MRIKNKVGILLGIVFLAFVITTWKRTVIGYWSDPLWIMLNDLVKYILFGLIGGVIISRLIKRR